MVTSGYFITLEGIEGAGKSTQVGTVRACLDELGISAIATREPGGTPLAEALRDILLTPREEPVLPETELLLMFAGRAQHLTHVIKPALEQGIWVVSDRFTDASFAYQGAGRGIPSAPIQYLEQWIQASLRPNLCFVFDLPAEVGLMRAKKRSQADRFETERVAFFERVRQRYLERAKQCPQNYYVIDASLPIEEVTADVAKQVKEYALSVLN